MIYETGIKVGQSSARRARGEESQRERRRNKKEESEIEKEGGVGDECVWYLAVRGTGVGGIGERVRGWGVEEGGGFQLATLTVGHTDD